MTGHSTDARRTDGGTALEAGVARVDITPETGRAFQGYVRPDMRAEGVAIRPLARALVLDDGERLVALVSADLLFGVEKDAVLERLDGLLGRADLLYAGTHTHASSEAGEWTADQVAKLIRRAAANREPAVAGWGEATVERANRTRSLEAHLANHGIDCYPGTGTNDLDPEGVDHPRETTLRLLRVDTAEGDPLAAWSQFPVHPTAFTPHNTHYSADIARAALAQFGDRLDAAPFGLFANGAQGDLIPVYDDYGAYAVAERVGERIARGMETAWERAGEALEPVRVAGTATTITFEGQTVEPGKRVASRATFGLPFLGGGENGPSMLYFLGLEGSRRPAALADAVHGRKIPVAPAPWTPELELQSLRIGDHLLLGVPGEPTVETGRRFRAAVAERIDRPEAFTVTVVGLANGYNGYFTTPEEYDQQHYEGGHTTFGKHSIALLEQGFAETAGDLLDPEPRADPQLPTVTPRAEPPVGQPGEGRLLAGPTGRLERGAVATVEWLGAGKGHDRPVGEPFVQLERRADGWETVASDLGLGFVWDVSGSRYSARYELPLDLPTGEYRLRVTGVGYTLETEPFPVAPATDLRVRGATIEGETLCFHAQHAPPDPDEQFRSRPVSPSGGELVFDHDGASTTAEYDDERGHWTAPAGDVERGDAVRVAAGGLTDEHGNRSAGPVTLRVGEVADVEWPPNLGPGGGRPPGPFGIGTWPF